VREALKGLPTKERVFHKISRVTVKYGVYSQLKYLLPSFGVIVEDEQFADDVTMRIAVPYDRVDKVAALLQDVTHGRLDLEKNWLGSRYL